MSIFDDFLEEKLRQEDSVVTESTEENEELMLEAMTMDTVPELKMVKKQVKLPAGTPLGRGCVCYLYTNSFENSKKLITDNTNFLSMNRYRYYYYPHLYFGKLFNKHYKIRDIAKRKEYYKEIRDMRVGVNGYPKVTISPVDNKNMYYDLHKYVQIFESVCGEFAPLKYIQYYWNFFTPLFTQKVYNKVIDKEKLKKDLLTELKRLLGEAAYTSIFVHLDKLNNEKDYNEVIRIIQLTLARHAVDTGVRAAFHTAKAIASDMENGDTLSEAATNRAKEIVDTLKDLKEYMGITSNQYFILVNVDQFPMGSTLKENIKNPLFCIYYTAMRNLDLLKKVNIDFYFYSGRKILKINPSKLDDKSYNVIRSQMKLLNYGTNQSAAVHSGTEEENIIHDEIKEEPKERILSIIDNPEEKEIVFDDELNLRLTSAPKSSEVKNIENKINRIVQKASDEVMKARTEIKDAEPVPTPKLVNLRQAKVKPEEIEQPTPEENREDVENLSQLVQQKAEDEINKDKELLTQIYNQIEEKKPKSVASSKRDEEIRKKQKDIFIDNLTIGDIEKIKGHNIPVEEKSVANVVETINDHMKTIKFENFEKSYNEKLLKKDITDAFLSLNSKSLPMYILKVDIQDSSDELNYKDTYTVLLEDENRKRHTVKVDIPKFLDNKFLYIGGNKKVIKHQSFFYPVVKIDEKTVHVVTNYSKIIIQRNDSKNFTYVDRFKKFIRLYDEIKDCVILGNTFATNKEYITTIEYDELSKFLIQFSHGNMRLYFSQEEIRKFPEFKEKEGFLCVGFKGKEPIYINTENQETEQAESIVDLMLKELGGDIYSKYLKVKGPKASIVAEGTVMKKAIPIGILLAYWGGFTSLIEKLHLNYRLENDAPKELKYNEAFIPFKDCYFVYQTTIPIDLIMNGFKVLNTEDYDLIDLDQKESYSDYILKRYGVHATENALMNFYDFMIDPITLEILIDRHMPTDIVELIIYAIHLLADSQYTPEINQGLSRIRSNEIIPAILYERLANAYIKYRNSNGRKALSLPANAVIKEILEQKTVEDYSTLNPSLELEICRTVSTKGFRGVNLDEAYKLEKRTYDKTMIGTMAASSSPDSNVGVLRTLTLEPSITNLRGYVDTNKPIDELTEANLYSPVELSLPLGGSLDDPTRAGHMVKQSKQVIPVAKSSPVLVSNGMEEVARFHLSTDFVVNAEENGKIVDYDEEHQIMIAQYKSGKYQAIDLSPNIVKNGGGGFFLSNKLITDLKVGDTFKANQALAWHKDFFTNSKYNNCKMNIGTLAKVAIMSTYNTYEDGTVITHKLANEASTEMVFLKSAVLGKNSTIEYIVNVGDHIEVGDPLIQFDQSYDDESLNVLLANMGDEDKKSALDKARNSILTKYSGVIEDIKIYSTIHLNEMSPSLKRVVEKYYKKISSKKEFLNKYDPSEGIVKCGILLNEANHIVKTNQYGMIKGARVDDGVLFEFYIKHGEPLEVGSKIANYTALKNTIDEVIPEGYEPWSEYRTNEEVSTIIASNSILSRMTGSIFYTALSYKCIIELKRHLLEIWEKSSGAARRKSMQDLIFKFFNAMDTTGANEKHYREQFEPMTDTQFDTYFRGFFKDENAYLVYNLLEYRKKNKITITMEEIEAAAKVLNVPLMENVYMPHLTMDKKRVICTKEPVPVGYIVLKRTQQTVMKKNGMSTEISERNTLTGQITGKDKNGRESDIENQFFISMGLMNTMKELNSARSDDNVAKVDMLREISINGYTKLEDLTDDIRNKQTLNLADVYLLGMGINSDLVTPGLMLKKELKKEL